MKVNVLMSSYNGEKYIEKQIESILSQSSSCDIELWVRDDGSSDKTIEILESYQEKGLLNWFSGDNLGPALSFFNLINRCDDADIYAFADQDDIWFPQKIQRAVDCLKNREKPTLYYSNAELYINNKETGLLIYNRAQKNFDLPSVSCNGGALGCTMMINNALRKVITSHEEPQKVFMHDFYILILCSAIHGEILYDNESTMLYRQHSGNVVGVKKDFVSKIKNRIKDILTIHTIGIAEQAEDILKTYRDILDDCSNDWLNRVANYKRSYCSKIGLAINREVKFHSKSMAVKIKLAILLGNR